jgi:putative ABC transport system substrate-binding protein
LQVNGSNYCELIPNLRRLAIMANPGYAAAAREMSEVQTAGRALNLETKIFEIHESKHINVAIETLKGNTDALYVCIDPLTDTNQITIAKLAIAARIPTMPGFRDGVRAGSLIFYGPNIAELFRRAAEFVDKILHGTKPADIPVEQPTKYDLVINIKAAKALGIEVPQNVLSIAAARRGPTCVPREVRTAVEIRTCIEVTVNVWGRIEASVRAQVSIDV